MFTQAGRKHPYCLSCICLWRHLVTVRVTYGKAIIITGVWFGGYLRAKPISSCIFDSMAKIFLPKYLSQADARIIFTDFPCAFVCKCERHQIGE